MDTVCGLGVMGGIMVDMGLTLCNYILLHQLTTRLNFIYLFIYNIYCASLSLLLLLISSQKMGRFALLPLPKCMAPGQQRTQVGCYRAAAVSCDIIELLTVKHIV